MTMPLFLDIETSHKDEGGFPTAIAWSMPDGTIKSVMIVPDDDWEPWDNAGSDTDIQHLIDQGVSGPDVIREINEDLGGQTVFVDGLDEDETTLEHLFETYGNTADFELANLSQLFPGKDIENLLAQHVQIAREFQLDINDIEDNVRTLLFLFEQNTA